MLLSIGRQGADDFFFFGGEGKGENGIFFNKKTPPKKDSCGVDMSYV